MSKAGQMSKFMLQFINACLALMTIGLAGSSLINGVKNPIYGKSAFPVIPALDSNLRFLGGVGIGLGIALLWTLPKIEKRGMVYRFVWICAFLGGAGRLWSWLATSQPPLPMLLFTLIELVLVPVLLYWQFRIAEGYK